MAKILVVDRDPSIRWLVHLVLVAQGHRVFDASTVEQAHEIAQRQRPQLVLIDIDFSAEELCQANSDATFLFMAANSSKDSLPVLQKPFSATVLAEAVREALV